jgi:hypothetical protein
MRRQIDDTQYFKKYRRNPNILPARTLWFIISYFIISFGDLVKEAGWKSI